MKIIKILVLGILIALMGCTSSSSLRRLFIGDVKVKREKVATKDIDKKVDELLKKMTLEEKIGQMVQAERNDITPEEVKEYKIGSILSGGGSVPGNNTPEEWVDMYNSYQNAALKTDLGIPIIYGVDAVHGHNNLKDATIFPHNIGLGAIAQGSIEKEDEETAKKLVENIGKITAKEVSATGLNWTFAPCVAVAQDIRWGRTYESFGEDPKLQEVLAASYIRGYQGDDYKISENKIVATAKHFVGDGGTKWGTGKETPIDKGETMVDETELRRVHLRGFEEAVNENVGTIMASFSSWKGLKMHAHKYLITDLLKGELEFDGVLVSDWEGIHGIKALNHYERVVKSVNAGVDMFMEPYRWKSFIEDLKTAVKNKDVSQERIDNAVSRILRLKYRTNLFNDPLATKDNIDEIRSEKHLEVAKDAVKKSLVLLKNEENILPLSKNLKIYIDGSNSDNIGNQCGGWTISWQGSGGDITEGTTIKEGIEDILETQRGKIVSDLNSADLAVVVIGEKPYCEGSGDDGNLEISNEDKGILKKVKESGIPTLVIMVSGRPMIVTDYIDDWNGFVQAWLPGTQGDGVAEVIFGEDNFYGRLPVTWPNSKDSIEDKSRFLFPYGYGLEM